VTGQPGAPLHRGSDERRSAGQPEKPRQTVAIAGMVPQDRGGVGAWRIDFRSPGDAVERPAQTKATREQAMTQTINPRIAALLLAQALAGCQEWMAEPVRVERNFGESVRVVMLDQIHDKDKATHPAAHAPDGMSGMKATKALQRSYQMDIGRPERVREMSQINVQSGGGSGGSGGSGGGGSGGGGGQ